MFDLANALRNEEICADICNFNFSSWIFGITLNLKFEKSLHCNTLHYGLRADILKKAIRKCLTLKIDFSANFNLTHDFFWAEALSTPQKLENAKMNLQISI